MPRESESAAGAGTPGGAYQVDPSHLIAREAARGHLRRGFAVVPVRGKVPWDAARGAPLEKWQDLRLREEDLEAAFCEGITGVGLLNGAPSANRNDVDIDCPEALALADAFLPRTAFEFGRTSAPRSHRIHGTTSPVKTSKFEINGETLVELRSTGSQTVGPGSQHVESGEDVRFDSDGEAATVEAAVLMASVRRLAAATLVARAWPPKPGVRHKLALALAGLLLRGGLSEAEVLQFIGEVVRVAGDEEARGRIADVITTARRQKAGQPFTGGRTLRDLLDHKIVAKLCEWLGFPPSPARAEPEPKTPSEAEGVPARLRGHDTGPLPLYDAGVQFGIGKGTWFVEDPRDQAGYRKATFREVLAAADPAGTGPPLFNKTRTSDGVDQYVPGAPPTPVLMPSDSNIARFLLAHPAFGDRLRLDVGSQVLTVHGPLPMLPGMPLTWPTVKPMTTVEAPHVPTWEAQHNLTLGAYLDLRWGVTRVDSTKILGRAIYAAGAAHAYNPVLDFLHALPPWDGIPRVYCWISTYCGVDAPAARIAGYRWILQAIARALRPGLQADLVLILEGEQGRGKSRLFDAMNDGIVPSYHLSLDLGNTEEIERRCCISWIVQLPELSALQRATVEKVKAFISKNDDIRRVFYAGRIERVPRRYVFGGTTNESEYLADTTGNRRFLPVAIPDHGIDVARFRADRDLLYAEALALVERGEKWWPQPEEEKLLAADVQERLRVDPWEEPIARYLSQPGRDEVTTQDLFKHALGMPEKRDHTPVNAQRIAGIMRKLRWVRSRSARDDDGRQPRGYRRPA